MKLPERFKLKKGKEELKRNLRKESLEQWLATTHVKKFFLKWAEVNPRNQKWNSNYKYLKSEGFSYWRSSRSHIFQ